MERGIQFPTRACGVRPITMHCASWLIRALRLSEWGTLFEGLREAGHKGPTIIHSYWKIMCFFNIKACQHILLHQIMIFSNFEIKIFFSQTPGILRETVLNLSAWLNICTSNRSFANESCSYWPIACIYFMKNLLLRFGHKAWHTSKFEIMNLSTQKTQHEWILCYNKTKWDACVFFLSTVPRCECKSWISV